MRGDFVVLLVLVLAGACLVDAFEGQVVLVDEIGSFSGGILKLKDVDGFDLSDKIYASENLASVGVIKFDVESSESEVYLNVVLTKGGEVVSIIDEGPFVLDGSEISIDRREGADSNVGSASAGLDLSVAVVDSNESEVEDEVEVEELETLSEDGVLVSEVVLEDSHLSVGVVEVIKDGKIYWILGVVVVLSFVCLRSDRVRGVFVRFNYFSDEGKLARLEARVARKDRAIERMKDKKVVRKKIVLAKKKLRREEEELSRMSKEKD